MIKSKAPVIFVVIVAIGLTLGTYVAIEPARTNQRTPDPIVNSPSVPSTPRPAQTPIIGKNVSLDEAKALANNSGFQIRFPTSLPDRLKLTDIRVVGLAPTSPGSNTLRVSEMVLIYSEAPLPPSATLSDLLNSGGFLLILQKRIPGAFEQQLEQLLGGQQEKGPVRAITVRGYLGYYASASNSELWWVDENMQLELVGGRDRFTMQALKAVAESIP